MFILRSSLNRDPSKDSWVTHPWWLVEGPHPWYRFVALFTMRVLRKCFVESICATTGLFLFPFVYISSGIPNLKGHSACPHENRTTRVLPDQTPCYALGLSFRKEMAKLPGLSKIRRTDWHQHGIPRAWPLGKTNFEMKGKRYEGNDIDGLRVPEGNPIEIEVNPYWKLFGKKKLRCLRFSTKLILLIWEQMSSSQASMPHPPGSCSSQALV